MVMKGNKLIVYLTIFLSLFFLLAFYLLSDRIAYKMHILSFIAFINDWVPLITILSYFFYIKYNIYKVTFYMITLSLIGFLFLFNYSIFLFFSLEKNVLFQFVKEWHVFFKSFLKLITMLFAITLDLYILNILLLNKVTK